MRAPVKAKTEAELMAEMGDEAIEEPIGYGVRSNPGDGPTRVLRIGWRWSWNRGHGGKEAAWLPVAEAFETYVGREEGVGPVSYEFEENARKTAAEVGGMAFSWHLTRNGGLLIRPLRPVLP